jgi:hypothetical protein
MRRSKKISDGPDNNLAAEYLIGQGCYVYTPFIEQGPVDIIALDKNGVFHYFDVKTLSRRSDDSIISRTLTDLQRKLGVQLLYVCLETHDVHKYPHHFNRHTAPKNSAQNAANRRFNGEKPATISELLHPESSQTDQSLPEAS